MTGDLASACKDWQGMGVRTRRARLKGWRPRPLNPLSAHPFFGASCETLWRPHFGKVHRLEGLERAEIVFGLDNLEELSEIIEGGFFGLRESDSDPLILNTE